MIYADFKGFVEKLPEMGRIFAVDWGARRTGYAVSDVDRDFVTMRGVTTDNPVRSLPWIITEIKPSVVGIVIGLPLYSDGGESETSKTVRLFADALAGEIDLPIVFLDENLTSSEAEDRIRSSGAKRGRRQKMSIDAMAASVLLEDALNIIKRNRR